MADELPNWKVMPVNCAAMQRCYGHAGCCCPLVMFLRTRAHAGLAACGRTAVLVQLRFHECVQVKILRAEHVGRSRQGKQYFISNVRDKLYQPLAFCKYYQLYLLFQMRTHPYHAVKSSATVRQNCMKFPKYMYTI